MEFELSRLFEKEIHYHVKVEIEKRELEAMQDFNTVAVFSTLDPLSKGFLDSEALQKFCNRHSKGAHTNINPILRRMSDEPDSRISFRQFSLAITPEAAQLSDQAAKQEFNTS